MLRVLIIDDSADDRLLAIRELKREFRVVQIDEVSNPNGLADALAHGNFDVVVTDYQLLWNDGLTILRTLKQRYPDRPVVMFTSSGSQEVAVEGMKLGLDDYVLKSANHYTRLATAVRIAVERSQERRRAAHLESRLQSLLNRLDVGVFCADLEGQVLEANASFLYLLGVSTLAEAQALNLNTIFPPRQRQMVGERLPYQQVYEWEGQLCRADGRLLWVKWNEAINIFDGNTSIDGLVEDISERKYIEAARQESEERFRTLADTAPVFLWLADPQKRWHFFNKGWLNFTGRNLAQEIGRGWLEGIHPGDRDQYWTRFLEAFSARQEFSIEYRLRRFDGEYRWLLDTGIPRYGRDGTFVGYIGSVLDITERKRAENALSLLAEAGTVLSSSLESETILTSVARLAVPDLADWCIIDILEEEELRRFAVVHEDPNKMTWAHELQRRYPPKLDSSQAQAEVLRTGASRLYPEISEEQLVAGAQDAEHLRILQELGLRSTMMVPLWARGRTLGIVTLIAAESGRHYTTQDLQIAEELARRAALAIDNAYLYSVAERDRKLAEAASRMKDEFLATLSHELRTPLNSILGWAQLLRERRLNETTFARAVETIERNAKLQTRLVEDILDVSQIISGNLRLEVLPIDLKEILDATIESMRPAINARSIELICELDPNAGMVSGDANRLQQVFWNLLSNAVKFTPEGGQIWLSFHKLDSTAQVQIRDTGIGISTEFLPYVFERFSQADSSTTRLYGGLGLGLAVARHLVELHGGTVSAQSAGQGQGATFIVELPLISQPSNPTQPNSARLEAFDATTALQGVRILIVDDEVDGRELLAFILEQYGAAVTTAPSAARALEEIQQSVPDLLISDIGMPEESGYALIRKVRARKPNRGGEVPAIALTAYATEEDRQQSLLAGFQAHVPKPVEAAQLIATVAGILGKTVPDSPST